MKRILILGAVALFLLSNVDDLHAGWLFRRGHRGHRRHHCRISHMHRCRVSVPRPCVVYPKYCYSAPKVIYHPQPSYYSAPAPVNHTPQHPIQIYPFLDYHKPVPPAPESEVIHVHDQPTVQVAVEDDGSTDVFIRDWSAQ